MAAEGASVKAAAIQLEAEVATSTPTSRRARSWATRPAPRARSGSCCQSSSRRAWPTRPELSESAPPVDGAPTQLLRELASRHGAHVGGSTLVRDSDGHVCDAFLLAGPDGELLGRHDKDLPTMWENALYVGGQGPGRIDAGRLTVGVALCWELMRTQTARRLAGHVGLVVGGSGWWSVPSWPPRRLFAALEKANHRRAIDAVPVFASYVGAPVVHSAHSGTFHCPWPLGGVVYHGHYQGGAIVYDDRGSVLAARHRDEGPGIAVADVQPARRLYKSAPERFWLPPRGALAAAAWAYHNPLGRRQYHRTHARRSLAAVQEIGA